MPRPPHILPIIVGAQFAGGSLWFAGNAVLSDLEKSGGLEPGAVGWLTSAVQLGFICGTLIFALLNVADRFRPRFVFLACALLGAASNAAIVVLPTALPTLLVLRWGTGFFLAGIYPVGMKIAASWFESGLGKALGFLVGALVLGTAFPHVLKAGNFAFAWTHVLLFVSALAAVGGVLLCVLVPEGPHLPAASKFDPTALKTIFSKAEFRASAFGYFGHMWELYAFWAVVPGILRRLGSNPPLDISLWSFTIIAVGGAGCVIGGLLSQRFGAARTAAIQVATSGFCCLLAPALVYAPTAIALAVLVVWGITVVGDSPLYSTLNAQTAPRALVGTALTIVTCIGFSITIFTIQLVTELENLIGVHNALPVLAFGPAFGLWALKPLLRARGS